MNKLIRYSLKELHEKKQLSEDEINSLQPVIDRFSFAITDTLYQQIHSDDPNDPIAKQFIPDKEELNILPEELKDPIGDSSHSPVKGVVHRYPDRCLLMPLTICPVYCRFCFRREKVGQSENFLSSEELQAAYDYIFQHPEIWEVILTGGDPLFLNPKNLDRILHHLCEIPHLGVIRIHTRIPVALPSKINANLLKILKKKLPIYVAIHANHPREFTEEAQKACHDLANHGIPLLGQSVLLKGVNDDIETLSNLMRCFIKNKIKPYYLHHPDLAQGTSHFRVSLEKGQSLMKQLRGRFSGICQPSYVLDIPGGYGKSPINPTYIQKLSSSQDGQKYLIEDYLGNHHPLYCHM